MISAVLRKLASGAEALERLGAAFARVEYALHEIAAAQRVTAVRTALLDAYTNPGTQYPGGLEQRSAARAYLGLPPDPTPGAS